MQLIITPVLHRFACAIKRAAAAISQSVRDEKLRLGKCLQEFYAAGEREEFADV